MNPPVLGHVGAVPECLPALGTLERLLSSVDSLVANVIRLVLKDAPTFAAFVGLLPPEGSEHRNPLKVIFK